MIDVNPSRNNPFYWVGQSDQRKWLSEEEYGWTQAGEDKILNGGWMNFVYDADRKNLDPKKAARLIYITRLRGYGGNEANTRWGNEKTFNDDVWRWWNRQDVRNGVPKYMAEYYKEMFAELKRLEDESAKEYNAHVSKKKKGEAEPVPSKEAQGLAKKLFDNVIGKLKPQGQAESKPQDGARLFPDGENQIQAVAKRLGWSPQAKPGRGVKPPPRPPRTTAAPVDPRGRVAGAYRKSSFGGDGLTADQIAAHDKALKGRDAPVNWSGESDYDRLINSSLAYDPIDYQRQAQANRVGADPFPYLIYDKETGKVVPPEAVRWRHGDSKEDLVFSAKNSGTIDPRDMGARDETGRMRIIDPTQELNEAGGYKYDPYTRKLYRTLRNMGLYMVETDTGDLLPARIDERGKMQITNLNGFEYDLPNDNYRVVNRTPIKSQFVPKRGVTEADMFDAAERGMASRQYNPALANAFWRRANNGGFAKSPLTDKQRAMMGDLQMRRIYNAASLGKMGAARMELADRMSGAYTNMREQMMHDSGYGRGINPQQIAFDQAQARFRAQQRALELENEQLAKNLAREATIRGAGNNDTVRGTAKTAIEATKTPTNSVVNPL